MPKWKVPFHENGNMMDYADGGYYKAASWLEPETEFEATLDYHDYGKGRSAVRFYFRDDVGKTYSFSMSEFHKALPGMVRGSLTGRFGFTKRGRNYSLVYLGA